jgi:hypothetical protein
MLTHDYTLICEHARLEMGGKWTIIGLTNGIGVPFLPFPLPMLTFFQALKADGQMGHRKWNVRLTELTTGKTIAQAEGGMVIAAAGPVYFPVALPNIQFSAFGTYTWSLEIEHQTEPILTQFEVAHIAQPGRPGAPPLTRRPN